MKLKLIITSIGMCLMFILLAQNLVEAQSFEQLHKGDEGEKVEWLQAELAELGYLENDQLTNIIDESTVEAISQYQKDHGLSTDGVAGKQTIGSLKVLQEGSEGILVYELQRKLSDLNYYHSDIDGKYGPLTTAAVVSFQQKHQLMVDGIAGPQTHKYIYYNQAQAKQKPVTEPNSSDKAEEKEQDDLDETAQVENNGEAASNSPQSIEADDNSVKASASEESESVQVQEGKTMQMEATAYTAYCNGCSGVTRTGIDLRANPNQKVVAVDPAVIPLGSRVYVEGYGEAIAGDTGGAIKGHKIDLFVQTKDEAFSFGRRQVTVTVLE
ncbi:peptidoglycan-binding protein [Bacillus sp. JCM 19041]|uniref:peptidoglycan-binding protein n=1 Tax=Bacillus sp. JCM 19041 TaxID=1460637 RepID=UPI0006D1F6A3